MFQEPGWGDMGAERSSHCDIPPASIRIRNVSVRQCGRPGLLAESVEEIQAKNKELFTKRLDMERTIDGKVCRGLTTAKIGSIYDMPDP